MKVLGFYLFVLMVTFAWLTINSAGRYAPSTYPLAMVTSLLSLAWWLVTNWDDIPKMLRDFLKQGIDSMPRQ